jgi:hypothetical protein
LATYYVLFFIHLESRRVSLAGLTRHPDEEWMQQMARNATGEPWGLILFGEASLRRALADFIHHYHAARNHQGKGNALLFPSQKVGQHKPRSRVRYRERLGGLLKYYSYAA